MKHFWVIWREVMHAREVFLSYLKRSNARSWSAWFLGVTQKYELRVSFKQKNGLIRKIRLVSKFMTSQPGKQTIAHYLRKLMQSDNEIWSVNRTQHFPWKIIRKVWWRNYSQNFLKSQNCAYLWMKS